MSFEAEENAEIVLASGGNVTRLEISSKFENVGGSSPTNPGHGQSFESDEDCDDTEI